MGDGSQWALFWESWELFREAALSGAMMGALLGMMGVYVVLRRMVFLSAALSQTAGLGVTLAFYGQLHLGLTGAWASPTVGAALTTFLAALLLMLDRSTDAGRRDSLLGLAFLVGSAGTLVVGTKIVQEIQDIQTLLFGTAVAVLPEDFTLVWQVTLGLGLVHALCWRGFVEVSFDPDGAAVRGLPARWLEGLLLVTLALAISVCTRVLGALPAFAFSVLPALAAIRLTPNPARAMLAGAVLGAVCGFGGYLVAFMQDWPVGASGTLVGIALVTVVMLGRGVWRLGRRTARLPSKK